MGTVSVNRLGYLVIQQSPQGRRTYACADRPSLVTLVERLTGRKWDSLPLEVGSDGMFMPTPTSLHNLGLSIGYPLHIYEET